MDIQTHHDNGILTLSVQAERIDSAVAIQFKDAIRASIDERSSRVLLDLGKVQFVDSSGLGAIVASMKFLAPERSLELAALTPDVDKVFRLTRMDTIFRIHSNVENATTRAAG